MNLGTLRALARSYIQESSTVPFGDALLNDMVNEGQERLCEIVDYSTATFTVTGGLVASQYDYALPSTLLSILAVAVNDSDAKLAPIEGPLSVQEMDDRFSSWRTDAAARPERWWLNYNALWVHPKPDATAAATPLEIRGTRWAPDMSADGDSPTDLPSGFHRTLAKYAAWRVLQMDKENPTAARMTTQWRDEWLADAGRLRNLVWGRSKADGEGLRIQRSKDNAQTAGLIDEEDE